MNALTGDTCRPPLAMAQAVARAREEAQSLTGLMVDTVVAVHAAEAGWRVIIDLLESRARVGRNDLISTYEMTLDAVGQPRSLTRLAKQFREDRQHRESGEVT